MGNIKVINIIIIIIINTTTTNCRLLSFGSSSPYTGTDKNKKIYT